MAKTKASPWWQFIEHPAPPSESPTPECFTDQEWADYYAAEREAVWNKRLLGSSIRKDMCEDCLIPYQLAQIKAGKCKPHDSAITPINRFATIAAGGEDPVKRRKSRAQPWSDEEDE